MRSMCDIDLERDSSFFKQAASFNTVTGKCNDKSFTAKVPPSVGFSFGFFFWRHFKFLTRTETKTTARPTTLLFVRFAKNTRCTRNGNEAIGFEFFPSPSSVFLAIIYLQCVLAARTLKKLEVQVTVFSSISHIRPTISACVSSCADNQGPTIRSFLRVWYLFCPGPSIYKFSRWSTVRPSKSLLLCKSHCNDCVKVPWCHSCARNTVAFWS